MDCARCSIQKGKLYNVGFTTIDAGTAENAFGIFHFAGFHHHLNGQAHRTVLSTGMTMGAFLRIRLEL